MGNTYSDIDVLRPHEKSGFHIILTSNAGNTLYYTVTASYVKAVESKPAFLSVHMNENHTGSDGSYNLVGEITNQASAPTKSIKVSADFLTLTIRL